MAESPTLLPTYPGQEIAAMANGPGQATCKYIGLTNSATACVFFLSPWSKFFARKTQLCSLLTPPKDSFCQISDELM